MADRLTTVFLPLLLAALLVPLVSFTRFGPAAAVGFRSFADYGLRTVQLSDPLPSQLELFPLDLPPTPGPVVTLFLHLRVELDPAGPPGTLSVWDQRAGGSALLLRVRWSPEPTGGILEWDTLDLFAGPRQGFVLGPAVELVLANIVPDGWRQPGTAPLTLHFEREGPVRVRSVLVYPDSGIEIARRGLPSLWVSVAAPRDPPPVGAPFELRVHLAPRGRTPPRRARLELLPSPCVRSASGASSLAWSDLTQATTVRLQLERLTAEPCSFQLGWGTESSSGTITVQLGRAEES
ncbi:hypothetical protein OO015_12380 [Thermomicrobium sp. 4228-Ro]|uniref:hypothetical protein n=1 Tax=Thermomicrobium sp. 4228-Ro TaxID=2993937 RepID=UPI0022497BCE|nr:hypothetical protein [Thermomicrobium sp. 4228-Ro]MCX2728287.1 hypothetical protein [Thermomicrobium sp. 4228-Ro]